MPREVAPLQGGPTSIAAAAPLIMCLARVMLGSGMRTVKPTKPCLALMPKLLAGTSTEYFG